MRRDYLTGLLGRKIVHVIFCLILLIPFTVNIEEFSPLSPLQFYLILMLISLSVNIIQIKRPLIRDELKEMIQRSREKMISEIREMKVLTMLPLGVKLVEGFAELDKKLRMIEDSFYTQINKMEKSYERIGGYIGATAGLVGAVFSYVFFNRYTYHGILALLIVDPAASIFGTAFGKRKWPGTNATVNGSVFAFTVFALFMFVFTGSFLNSIVLSIVAVISEAYGVEDNLFIPVFTSLAAFILKV